MKLQNWLSVLTFDVVKYIRAGGQVAIEWTQGGLVLYLKDVMLDTPGVNARFLSVAPNLPSPASRRLEISLTDGRKIIGWGEVVPAPPPATTTTPTPPQEPTP